MQLCKILVACCLLCGFITIAAAHFLPLEGISVKIKASKFLNSVFREKGIDLDPRTWVVDDTDKVPKTWTVRSMPQCLLTRQWMESLGWVVKLYHEETPYLKLIVRVTAKVIITPKFGGLGGLVPLPIKYEVYKGNKQLKPVAVAIFPPGIEGPELRKALRESLNSTLPIVFHEQIPPSDATVIEVRRWIKSWFVGRGKSSTAITKSFNRLRWDGKYLWKHGNRQMQKDLEAVGISKAYSKALARDIIVARNQFDGWRRFSTIVMLLLSVVLLLAVLYFGYYRFFNLWN